MIYVGRWEWGTVCKCKKATHAGNGVHTVDTVNICGGDPSQYVVCSTQYAVNI